MSQWATFQRELKMEHEHLDALIDLGSASTETRGVLGPRIDGEGVFGSTGLVED
jgi:hypothetical protein